MIFSGATAVGGVTVDGEYVVQATSASDYTITVDTPATSSATGGGSVTAKYLISAGSDLAVPNNGWGHLSGVMVLGVLVVQVLYHYVCGICLTSAKILYSPTKAALYTTGSTLPLWTTEER